MFDRELIQATLRKIQKALETILQRAETIHTSNDFLTTPSGVERLERSDGHARYYPHHYFDIDAGIVFEVIKDQLPVVKSTIDRMLLDNA